MQCSIRPAIRTDVSDILGMIKDLALHEHKADQVKTCLEDLERDGFSKNPLFCCLLAQVCVDPTQESRVAGYALYYFIYSSWAGKSLHLDDLYVKPEFRGLGVGKRLLAEVAKVGHDSDCERLQLMVSKKNASARAFYGANGAQDLTETEGWHAVRFDRESLKNLSSGAM